MRVGLDIDGTLYDTPRLWIQKLNWVYDEDYTVDDLTDWDRIYKLYDISEETALSWLNEVEYNHNFYPGAYQAAVYLCTKYDVYFISGTHSEKIAGQKYGWLMRRFPNMDWRLIYCRHQRQKVFPWMDVIIDDNPVVTDQNINKTVCILMDRPWNDGRMTWGELWQQLEGGEFEQEIESRFAEIAARIAGM